MTNITCHFLQYFYTKIIGLEHSIWIRMDFFFSNKACVLEFTYFYSLWFSVNFP